MWAELEEAIDDWRLSASLIFLAIVVGVVALRAREQALAPWVGVYGYYAVFWAFLLIAAIGMILLIRRRAMSWWIILVFSCCFAGATVALSLVWNQPFSVHDSWIHLAQVDRATLDPEDNTYPLFHALVIVLSDFAGVTHEAALSRVTAVAAIAGASFLLIAVRRHSTDRIGRQTAAIVLVPTVYSGFTARPFTLAIPFVLLFYWFLLAVVAGTDLEWRRTVLGMFFVLVVYLHPIAAFMVLAVGGCAWLLSGRRGPLADRRWEIHPYTLLAVAIALAAHLLLVTGSGEQIITSTFAESAAEGSGLNQDAGFVIEALSSWANFLETLARSSYVLLIGSAVAVSLLDEFGSRRFDPSTVVPGITAGVVVGAFTVLAVFFRAGIGLPRIFAIAPIVAAPAVVLALRSSTHSAREIAAVGLAIAIVLAGSLGAYQSRLTGGAEYSANEQQVAAIDWMVEFDPVQIVGTRMTFWVLEGRYSYDLGINLSATNATGRYTTSRRNASYSWNVSDRQPDTLYVVDGVERERARQFAIEGADTPVRCYRLFEREQSRIYQNDDTSIYLRTLNTTDDCLRG